MSTLVSIRVNNDQRSVIRMYNSQIFLSVCPFLFPFYLCKIFACAFVQLLICLQSYLSSKRKLITIDDQFEYNIYNPNTQFL